jgi:hypothetical protein
MDKYGFLTLLFIFLTKVWQTYVVPRKIPDNLEKVASPDDGATDFTKRVRVSNLYSVLRRDP